MSNDVWVGPNLGPAGIGNMQGLHGKFFGEEWTPAEFVRPAASEELVRLILRYAKGETLQRRDFPEALAVFSDKHFRRIKDLFAAEGFWAVKGKLAEVLMQFDLGAGGLVPLPIYKADRTTPVEGKFYILNFGGPKDTLVPAECRRLKPSFVDPSDGRQVWKLGSDFQDGDVAVSDRALVGADIWVEKSLRQRVFMSGRLVEALDSANPGLDFRLKRCRVIETSLH